MDERASALDPIATQRIEELIYRLRSTDIIVIKAWSITIWMPSTTWRSATPR